MTGIQSCSERQSGAYGTLVREEYGIGNLDLEDDVAATLTDGTGARWEPVGSGSGMSRGDERIRQGGDEKQLQWRPDGIQGRRPLEARGHCLEAAQAVAGIAG